MFEPTPPGWLLIKVTRRRPCNSRCCNDVPIDCLRLPLSVFVCPSFAISLSFPASRYHTVLRLFLNLISAALRLHLRLWMCPLRRRTRGSDRRGLSRGTSAAREVCNVLSPAVCFSSSLDLSEYCSHAVLTHRVLCQIRFVQIRFVE